MRAGGTGFRRPTGEAPGVEATQTRTPGAGLECRVHRAPGAPSSGFRGSGTPGSECTELRVPGVGCHAWGVVRQVRSPGSRAWGAGRAASSRGGREPCVCSGPAGTIGELGVRPQQPRIRLHAHPHSRATRRRRRHAGEGAGLDRPMLWNCSAHLARVTAQDAETRPIEPSIERPTGTGMRRLAAGAGSTSSDDPGTAGLGAIEPGTHAGRHPKWGTALRGGEGSSPTVIPGVLRLRQELSKRHSARPNG